MMGPLEAELGRRADAMDPRQLLMVADLWRCLRRVVPKFLERLYCSAEGWRWSNLGPAELVQLVYVMGEGRTSTPSLLLVLGPQLLRHLNQLTPEEVGVLCLGLFKSQSSLSLHDVTQLVGRACAVLPQMSDYGLVNVLKLLRFSHLDHQRFLKAIGKEVPKRAPHMGVQGLMHVALACSALHFRDDGLLRALADRLPALALQCRSKDAAKLLWAFGTVGFPSSQAPRLYPSLEEAMRERADEFRRYPEHLLTGLLGLAFAGIFPRDLLALALSPESVELAVSSPHLELKKDLFTLDATVGLEVPDWAGPRVQEGLAQEVTAQLWSFVQQDVCVKPSVLEAEALLQSLLGGARFVRKHMILPHTRSIDLEVHLDPSGDPIPLCSEDNLQGQAESATKRSHLAITEDLLAQLTKITVDPSTKQPDSPPAHSTPPTITSDEPFPSEVNLTEGLLGSPLPQPTEGVQRLAVQVTNRNQFCYHSNHMLGLHTLKRRQLALLGYRVVELYYWEWFRLLKRSRSERLTYLHSKIFEDLD
ncbi:hypothetical protein COCON_G00164910 [Conger conger]|uniref:RAP domain-containing protein n=1 Tax=Conger conger TaxID=82655 RepID=A0A9Q1D6Q2_CONCO|nr:hypothetical protein COCON_G00164910 [Conger conger]